MVCLESSENKSPFLFAADARTESLQCFVRFALVPLKDIVYVKKSSCFPPLEGVLSDLITIEGTPFGLRNAPGFISLPPL